MRTRPIKHALYGALALAVSAAACGDDDKTDPVARDGGAEDDAAVRADASDDGDDAGTSEGDADTTADDDAATADDCVADPQTNDEIINACTDAEKVEKDPELPLLLSDGGLPPLP